jgi:hypothetical protein
VSDRLHRALRPRLAAVVLCCLGAGTALAACGDAGTSLAQQSCVDVHHSITLFDRSQRTADPTEAAKLRAEAVVDLNEAEPLASEAANDNGQWQDLMTTLSESPRVPEQHLITALQASCQQADSNVFGQPGPPMPGG